MISVDPSLVFGTIVVALAVPLALALLTRKRYTVHPKGVVIVTGKCCPSL
jgi:hypothetical protein